MKKSVKDGNPMQDLLPGQIKSLKSIVDALFTPLKAPKGSTETDRIYWEHQLSQDDDFMEAIINIIRNKLAPTQRCLMLALLTAFASVPGTILLVGSIQTRPFVDWPVEDRTQGLLRMQHSTFLQRRQAFQSLKRLVFHLAFTYRQKETGVNPFWSAIGYPGPPLKAHPPKDLVPPDISLAWSPNFQSIKCRQDGVYSLDCDIVIVGSGEGGGVAAQVLSKAGYSVVVLEKAPYLPPARITPCEGEGMDKLYDGHGLVASADGNIIILSGSALGGRHHCELVLLLTDSNVCPPRMDPRAQTPTVLCRR